MQKKIDFFKILMCTSTLIETLENKLRQDKFIHKLFHCWILITIVLFDWFDQ